MNMNEYLLFRLYGPMAAWGDIAVGEIRHSYPYPSKSAVLGLIAAALGIKSEQEEDHRKLNSGYGFSVLVNSPGIPLSDYHTAQVPPSGTGHNHHIFATRRDELATLPKNELKTILSRRDYRMDAFYIVALWERAEAPHDIKDIASKLISPMYALYLGRKSCPLALPVEPQVVMADNLRDAFEKTKFSSVEEFKLPDTGKAELYWEEDADSGMKPQHIFERRDISLSRKRWQFDVRRECHASYLEEG
jgi:CRISPR system Cascade subunit CasD